MLLSSISRALRTLGRFLLTAMVIFLVITVLAVLTLRWVSPPTTAFILRWQVAALFSYKPTPRREWVDYQAISPHMALAVVAAEDQKFPFHHGFDIPAIQEAIRHNRQGKSLRGASTVSQQVAKNLFLWPGRSYLRKGLEAYLTFLIEVLWPKQRILEVYLNIAYMGGNAFGVESASQRYFNKSARWLSPPEAALLAAMLPSPARFSVEYPSAYMVKRQNWILKQMKLLGGAAYLDDI